MPFVAEIENVWIYDGHLYCSVHKHVKKSNGGVMGSGIAFKLY